MPYLSNLSSWQTSPYGNEYEKSLIWQFITLLELTDVAGTALKLAEALIDPKLAHSNSTYPYPPEKEVVGYG